MCTSDGEGIETDSEREKKERGRVCERGREGGSWRKRKYGLDGERREVTEEGSLVIR